MADYITTHVKASKDVIDAMINTIAGHEWEDAVDFNLIVPVPDDIYQGNLGEKEREFYGSRNWYDWNTSNWGTKWNAAETERRSDKSVYFDTAWAPPFAYLEALSRKFPTEVIKVRVAGEYSRSFAGAYIFLNGVRVEDPKSPVTQSEAMFRFGRKVRKRQYV